MILITLGTIPYPFDRVVDWLEILLDKGLISEPVFFQHGVTDVSSIKNYTSVTTRAILYQEEINEIIQNSRLIISHAGQGSTTKLARTDKSFIIIPREKRYREHIDDHQLDFASKVSAEFGICYCVSLTDLQKYILNPPIPIKKELFGERKLGEHLLSIFPPNLENSQHTRKNTLKQIFIKNQKAI